MSKLSKLSAELRGSTFLMCVVGFQVACILYALTSLETCEATPLATVDSVALAPMPAPDADSALAAVLANQRGDSTFVPNDTLREIAHTIHETSQLEGLDPELLARLVWIESHAKPWALGPPINVRVNGALISTHAVGLGQIVPELWLGVFPQCGTDLSTIHTNICYTALILKHYLTTHPTPSEALLAYNGCLSAHCQSYAPSILDY